MNPLEVIGHKRDGREHTSAEIQLLLDGYVKGDIPDYQIAAWLMAVCIRGMTPAETLALWQNTGQSPTNAANGGEAAPDNKRSFWWYVLLAALTLAVAETIVGNQHLSIDKEAV